MNADPTPAACPNLSSALLLPAGPTLDMLIAQKLFGWHDFVHIGNEYWNGKPPQCGPDDRYQQVPWYSRKRRRSHQVDTSIRHGVVDAARIA